MSLDRQSPHYQDSYYMEFGLHSTVRPIQGAKLRKKFLTTIKKIAIIANNGEKEA